MTLALVLLGLALAGPVSIAGNQVASDPPAWLRPYAGWAAPMFAAGSLLIVVAGVAVHWLDRSDVFIIGWRAALDAQDRRRFLERVGSQVSDLLWQPPEDPEPLRLELAARPELVGTPRELFARRLAERGEPATVDAAFEAAEGALLLVGAPGAGKTRLLAELAAHLVARADHDPAHPIPALVNLASWAAPQPLSEWLAGALRDRYEVPAALGQAWIAADRVLPLLDGLDEVADPAACASAIDAFRAEQRLLRNLLGPPVGVPKPEVQLSSGCEGKLHLKPDNASVTCRFPPNMEETCSVTGPRAPRAPRHWACPLASHAP